MQAGQKFFFVVLGTVGLVLNMDISQGFGSRYTFEKHAFNLQHASYNFAKALCGAFSKQALVRYSLDFDSWPKT